MLFENNHGVCPNCQLGSGFKRENVRRIWPSTFFYRETTPPSSDTEWVDEQVLVCLHCRKTVVLFDRYRKESNSSKGGLIERRLIYPEQAPRELHASVPAAVRSFYREASVSESAGALRGASVLYRAAVEELAKERGASGRTLYDRIEDLKTKSLAVEIVDDLHEARMLGNDSIHDGLEYSADEIADVAGLIEEATVQLYVQPAERLRMREARKTRRSGS